MQQNHLALLTFSNQDLAYTRIDSTVVEAVCPCGQYKILDTSPRFTCANERGYVMKSTRKCRSAECNPNGKVRGKYVSKNMAPVSEGLIGVCQNRTSLRAEKRQPLGSSNQCTRVIRSEHDLPSCLPAVTLWCVRCKEKTKIQSPFANKEGTRLIDKDVRWTLGRSRPLYIVKESLCRNCPGGGRLIPVHQAVPFIYSGRLRSFVAQFGQYGDDIIAQLLDEWPSSSRDARSK